MVVKISNWSQHCFIYIQKGYGFHATSKLALRLWWLCTSPEFLESEEQ